MAAVREQRQRRRLMRFRRHHDRDRVAGAAKLLEAREGAAIVLAGDLGGAALIEIVDADELRLRQRLVDAGVVLAERPHPDDAASHALSLHPGQFLTANAHCATFPAVLERNCTLRQPSSLACGFAFAAFDG